MFQPLRRDLTLSSRVEQEIERLITDSHLAPGERLLPERDLGERFGVSRTVVREAVRSLAAKGLLEVRTGNGTYVEDRSHASAAEALARLLRLAGVSSPGRTHAIYELRRPLEIAIAELAAMRATPEEVATLKHWVDVIQQPGLDDAGYIEADVRFHVALAEATHNPLFVAVLHSMSSLMNAIREAALAVAGAQQEGRHSHELIYQRVAAHDVSGARRAMAAHMDSSESILGQVIDAAEAPGPEHDTVAQPRPTTKPGARPEKPRRPSKTSTKGR